MATTLDRLYYNYRQIISPSYTGLTGLTGIKSRLRISRENIHHRDNGLEEREVLRRIRSYHEKARNIVVDRGYENSRKNSYAWKGSRACCS
ncbi:MAG: hypothetical protein RQ885_07890 [Desulfurococcales archaeon]|nr:hypothetical protein [Desulfurococcales archaeon]